MEGRSCFAASSRGCRLKGGFWKARAGVGWDGGVRIWATYGLMGQALAKGSLVVSVQISGEVQYGQATLHIVSARREVHI